VNPKNTSLQIDAPAETVAADIKPGFYWARTNIDQKWDTIVQAWGTVPFLRLRAWRLKHSDAVDLEAGAVLQWGPRIECPPFIAKKG
jgi:hypothetical protein